MRRVTVLLASTAIALGLGTMALAQTGPGTKGPGTGERFRTQFFERLDTNKDGKITKAEYEASRAADFKAADKNGDGKITADELQAARGDRAKRGDRADRGDRPGRGERAGRADRGINFERADAAKKGFLTQEDLTKLRSARFEAALKKRFEGLDTNRDGKLTADELPAERREFVLRADANKDGAVTFDEFAARPRQFLVRRIEAEFKALDADGDGKLTKAEVDAARGKPMLLLLADANKGGAVTKHELAKTFAGPGGAARGDAVGDRVFEALDADKDGKISAAEWQVSGERRFARLDRNKDGAVTADEISRRREGRTR